MAKNLYLYNDFDINLQLMPNLLIQTNFEFKYQLVIALQIILIIKHGVNRKRKIWKSSCERLKEIYQQESLGPEGLLSIHERSSKETRQKRRHFQNRERSHRINEVICP